MERKFHGIESSLYGLFAPWNESAEERKGQLPTRGHSTSLNINNCGRDPVDKIMWTRVHLQTLKNKFVLKYRGKTQRDLQFLPTTYLPQVLAISNCYTIMLRYSGL